MKINYFITLMLSLNLLFACDDKSSDKEDEVQQEVSAGSEAENPDMNLPVQMMDFDTIEIEPDEDMAVVDIDLD